MLERFRQFWTNVWAPLANLFLNLADQAGVTDLERFGDSTGRLANV